MNIFKSIIAFIILNSTVYASGPISYVASPIEPPYSVNHTFGNGTKVKIISIKEYKLSNGDRWLQYRYITNLDLNDQQLLLKEAKAIWPSFKSMTEAYKHTLAVMAPSHQSGPVLALKTESK